jgi:hypothetical protein
MSVDGILPQKCGFGVNICYDFEGKKSPPPDRSRRLRHRSDHPPHGDREGALKAIGGQIDGLFEPTTVSTV